MKNPKTSQLYFNVLSMYESVSTSVNKVVSPFLYSYHLYFLNHVNIIVNAIRTCTHCY